MMRGKYPRISVIEAAFIVFYVAAGAVSMRIFSSKPVRPTLTAVSVGTGRRARGEKKS